MTMEKFEAGQKFEQEIEVTLEHTTVGYAVDGLRHLAPTPVGNKVVISVELTEIDRNRLTYRIEAHEGEQRIAVATHKRAVIPIQ